MQAAARSEMKTHWQLLTEHAAWPPRDSPGVVVFRDRIWILGGWQFVETGKFRRLNDVWCSVDGLTWEQVTPEAPWPARNLPGCVVFSDRIWLMGGCDNTQSLADLWCSADGQHWEQVAKEAPWGRRSTFGCVVHDGRIWVVGGLEFEGREQKRDVWCSDDGVHWDLVTDSPGWEKRSMFPVVVFDGRMWILGGGIYHDRKRNCNDVWCSADGIEWQPITRNAAWEGRRFHKAVALGEAMWIFGGVITEATNMNDVWYSLDGEQWELADHSAPWPIRHEPACLTFQGKAWLSGGYSGALAGSTLYNDIWTMETVDPQ